MRDVKKLINLVIIIKGRATLIRNNALAKKFYIDIKKYILSKFDVSVEYDNGKPMTVPNMKAILWIGHSRGASRLQYAGKNIEVIAFGTTPEKGITTINNIEDNAISGWNPEPNKYHYYFSNDMKKAIDNKLKNYKIEN